MPREPQVGVSLLRWQRIKLFKIAKQLGCSASALAAEAIGIYLDKWNSKNIEESKKQIKRRATSFPKE